jgi:transglutaminase-like putative cysteine protease
MLIKVPYLQSGATARAVVTCQVTTRTILPPEETASLKIPKRVPSKLRVYTNGSPYIEVKHQKIRSLSREILKDLPEETTDWEKIEKIYDYVLENVEYVEGPDKSAIDALRDGQSDCQGRSALFIALCRVNKIPARMVWVHGHVYPEFYLQRSEEAEFPSSLRGGDGGGAADAAASGAKRTSRRPKDPPGDWYPAESAGTRAFGEMPLARTILQKGDNFRIPERDEKLRYASDFTFGLPTPGGGKPKVTYIREHVQ